MPKLHFCSCYPKLHPVETNERVSTTLFCYIHRKFVCEHCLLDDSQKHDTCLIGEYTTWLKTPQINHPKICQFCDEAILDKTIRLPCHCIFHTDCLQNYLVTTPAAITDKETLLCPSCTTTINYTIAKNRLTKLTRSFMKHVHHDRTLKKIEQIVPEICNIGVKTTALNTTPTDKIATTQSSEVAEKNSTKPPLPPVHRMLPVQTASSQRIIVAPNDNTNNNNRMNTISTSKIAQEHSPIHIPMTPERQTSSEVGIKHRKPSHAWGRKPRSSYLSSTYSLVPKRRHRYYDFYDGDKLRRRMMNITKKERFILVMLLTFLMTGIVLLLINQAYGGSSNKMQMTAQQGTQLNGVKDLVQKNIGGLNEADVAQHQLNAVESPIEITNDLRMRQKA